MDVGLYQGIAGMSVAQRRLDAITQNLANLSTPAYKQTSSANQAELVGRGARRHLEMVTREAHDFSQGQLERTEGTYDLALLGEGFFVVEGAQGDVYTRNGSFRIDDKGVLQSHDGSRVAWEGNPGKIVPIGAPVVVDRGGMVTQAGEQVGRLKVVNFDDPSRLKARNDGTWQAPAGLAARPSQAEVHQGAIERSNVNSVEQLIELIQVQRNFESATSLVNRIDETYRRLNAVR
jgi:flagellar basal body rod protein FlgG